MDKAIKFHRIDRQIEQHREAIDDRINAVLKNGQVLGGENVAKLEQEVSKMTGRKYALCVGSCTDALSLSLLGLGIGAGDEVLVTPFTFPASYTCIDRVGATKVFLPVDGNTLHIDIERIPEFITPKTKAIIVVNLFGDMMNMDRLTEVLKGKKLSVIEDAAQSFTGKGAGSYGDVSCISFDPTKVIPCLGTGGMILTDCDTIYHKVSTMHYKNCGTNSQMSEIDASICSFWLDINHQLHVMRNFIAEAYRTELRECVPSMYNDINHKFVIRPVYRNRLKDFLEDKGIETKIHYPSDDIKDVLSLPIYPTLRNDELEYIIKCVKEFYL